MRGRCRRPPCGDPSPGPCAGDVRRGTLVGAQLLRMPGKGGPRTGLAEKTESGRGRGD
jgi:hypothetical protein